MEGRNHSTAKNNPREHKMACTQHVRPIICLCPHNEVVTDG